jgi:hypothetical protein
MKSGGGGARRWFALKVGSVTCRWVEDDLKSPTILSFIFDSGIFHVELG